MTWCLLSDTKGSVCKWPLGEVTMHPLWYRDNDSDWKHNSGTASKAKGTKVGSKVVSVSGKVKMSRGHDFACDCRLTEAEFRVS